MEKEVAQHWWDVVNASPALTIIAVVGLIGVVWKIVDWAYQPRIEALLERLALANDRLAASNDELAKTKSELEEHKTGIKSAADAINRITRTIEANTVSIRVSAAPSRSFEIKKIE